MVIVGCGGHSTDDRAAAGGHDGPPASSSSRSSTKQVDACTLITTDEVAQVLGEHSADHATYDVRATTETDGSCTYAWTVDGSGDEFTVNVFPASGYVPQPGIEPRRIDGIGDEAFEEVGSFYARVGDRMVGVVNVQEGEGSDEALLRIAAGRLAD
jgi:hypothetical protein